MPDDSPAIDASTPPAHGASNAAAADGTAGISKRPADSADENGEPAVHGLAEGLRQLGGPERELVAIELAETTAAGVGVGVGDKAGFRLAAFGALLIVVLFAGYGLGRLNNSATSASAPVVGATAGSVMPGMAMDESQPHAHATDGTVAQGATVAAGAAVGGLSLSAGGLTLTPAATTFAAGKRQKLSFRIAGAGGAPVTTYAIVHDKPLHLIVVRRDLTGFQHLHPAMAADGTWSVDLTLAQPGVYRMIADFTALVGGSPIATTLGTDLTVPGDYAPAALPAPVGVVDADGFSVGYEGVPITKSTQPIMISVVGPDHQAAALEPYLGAYGHLVVLREGDLAYLHVHPEAQLVDGKVKFWLAAPSGGTYRMFFDFQVAGKVHTAAWTVDVR